MPSCNSQQIALNSDRVPGQKREQRDRQPEGRTPRPKEKIRSTERARINSTATIPSSGKDELKKGASKSVILETKQLIRHGRERKSQAIQPTTDARPAIVYCLLK
ncbi:MAG: hypothetical protein SW833_20190 [Cyanobacteriota bacterium]|nr:hypothetical protein [Cyanobacteriota bacterium]